MKYVSFHTTAVKLFDNLPKTLNELAATQDEIKDRWNSSDNRIEDALLLAKVLYRILKQQTRNENEKIFFRIIEILFSVSYENLRRIEQIYDINLMNTELPNSKHEFICLKNLNISKFATDHYIKNFIKRIINDFSKLLLDLIDASKFKTIKSSRIQSDIIAYAEHTLSKEKIYRSYNKKGSVNSQISSIRSAYLKELQSSLDKEMFKFGHNSFVNGRNVAIVSREHWHKKDQEIQLHYQNRTQKMELAIDDYLESAQSEKSLLVAAPFGTGKSTSLLNIAKHYSILFEQNENTHLPIFVYLRNGLDSVYGNLDLDGTFDLLRVKDEKILLILDALDEYPNELSNLMEKMNTKYEKYTNLKIIFSSRLAPDYPALLGFETYLRILPFNYSQVSIYLKNLFDISRKDDPTSSNELILDDLSYLGLDEEEITKPLFIWLIFQIRDLISLFINRSRKWDEMNYDNPIIKLNKNERKTIIYLFFISNIIEGKYGQLSKSDNWDIHIKEKRILRKIAFLKNLYQERLTEKVLKSYKLFVGIKAWDIEDYSKLIQAYFVLSNNKMDKVVTFLHQTFNEYLLAENYVESMVKKSMLFLTTYENYSSISVTTFMNGLLSLLQNNRLKEYLSKYHPEIDMIFENLTDSFGYDNKGLSIIHEIRKNSLELLDSTDIPLKDLRLIQGTQVHRNLIGELLLHDYSILWNYRWIALYTYLEITNSNLLERAKIDTNKLESLIKSNGNRVYYYINDMRNLNFTKSNLPSCQLISVDLDSCKFVDSNLRGVNFWFSNLTNTDFTNADMSGSNLSGFSYRGFLEISTRHDARFNQAHMEKTELIDSNLTNLHFYGTRFLDTNLAGTNFNFTELDHSLFINVILEKTNFDHTTIRDCFFILRNFQDSTFQGAYFHTTVIISDGNDFDFLVSKETTFDHVYTDNPLLINYINSSGCIGTPILLKTREEVKEELRKISLTEEALEKLMVYCYYKE